MKCKFLTSLAGLALIFSACSSDAPVGGEQNKVEKGDPTYASFTIKMKKNTRAAGDDENADAPEQTINDLNVYIFSGGVLEKAARPEVNEYVTVPIAVTTGQKVVYAVNGDLGIELTEETTKLADFEKALFAALEENIAVADQFTMIGKADATIVKCTEAQALANPIRVNVDRAAAKVQVIYGAEVKVRPTLAATFGNAEFALAQQARQMYVTLGARFTPLGAKVNGNGTYPGLVQIPATYPDNYFIAAPSEVSAASADNKYTGECVVAAPTTGNVTFSLVRLKCTPTGKLFGGKSLPADGSFWVAARNDAPTASWIFAADENYDMIYFASESDARKYITDARLGSSYKAYKYDKGLAYYRVNIINNDEATDLSEKYRTLRNNYYRINVTDIRALGAPTGPGVVPTDPDTPIEQDSWLAAEIDVRPWTLHVQDTPLQ